MELSFTEELAFFNQVDDYKSYVATLKSLLGRCHTQEELDTVKDAIEEVKTRLMDTNLEFRGIIGKREQAVKLKTEYEQAIHRAKMSESRNDAERTHREAIAKADRIKNEAMFKAKVDDWVANTKYKTYEPEEKKRQIETGLWCPICQEENKRGNMVNNKPTCTKCWHELVTKEKLRDYPRKYRRSWKKGRKNKS